MPSSSLTAAQMLAQASTLKEAIEVLDGEVEAWQKANPPVDFKYAR